MKRIMFLVFVFCLMLTVPAFVSAHANAEKEEIKATICKLMDKVSRTAETLDAAKALSVLSDDPKMVFFFDSKLYTKAELIKTLTEIYSKLESMKITMHTPTVQVLGPDTAVWTATGQAESVAKTGERYTEMLTETWIWKKESGEWRVVHYTESVKIPPATTKAGDKK